MNTDNYNYYKNAGYRNTRNHKRILILDVDDSASDDSHLGSGGEFNIELFEPLIIDKQSEVYLDNFISFNSNISNIPENSAFCLKINEFNINSNVASSSNNNEIFNSIIIPNEHNSVANNHGVVLHKAKKFNYICDINPGKIGSISGKITNLAGQPIFHGLGTTDLFTYALTGLASGQLDNTVPKNSTFTGIGTDLSSETTTVVTGTFLADHHTTTTTIHFSTTTDIGTLSETDGGGSITFTGVVTPDGISIGTVTIVNTSVGHAPNIQLITGPGRFVAEFSINAIE